MMYRCNLNAVAFIEREKVIFFIEQLHREPYERQIRHLR